MHLYHFHGHYNGIPLKEVWLWYQQPVRGVFVRIHTLKIKRKVLDFTEEQEELLEGAIQIVIYF